MTNVEGRVIQLELLVKTVQAQLAAALTRLDNVEQLARSAQGITYNWGGGSGGGVEGSYWALAPPGGIPASSGRFPTITPTSSILPIYQDIDGTLISTGESATCYWWYRDACPQNTLLKLKPLFGIGWDIICNSCTVVNP